MSEVYLVPKRQPVCQGGMFDGDSFIEVPFPLTMRTELNAR